MAKHLPSENLRISTFCPPSRQQHDYATSQEQGLAQLTNELWGCKVSSDIGQLSQATIMENKQTEISSMNNFTFQTSASLLRIMMLSLALISFLVPLKLQAQITPPPIKWDKKYGGSNLEQMYDAKQTSDGGFIFGGRSRSNISGEKSENSRGGFDYWIVKVDALGNKQWDRTYGGSGDDILSAIQQTSDGGYILGGYSDSDISGEKSENSKGFEDFWIIKVDALGNKQWDKTIGGDDGDFLVDLLITSDGGYLLAGGSYSNISGDKSEDNIGDYDHWLVKVDNLGNVQWDNTYGGDDYDESGGIIATSDGGYFWTGTSYSGISGDKSMSSKGDADYWLLKLDEFGNIQWDKAFGSNSRTSFGQSSQQTSDGGYIVMGTSDGNISADKSENRRGSTDYWILKLDALGNRQWDKTLGGIGFDFPRSIDQTLDGGYIIVGFSPSNISGEKSENSRGGEDFWVVKLDALGNVQWDKTIGGSSSERPVSIIALSNGDYFVAGNSPSNISGEKTQNSTAGTSDYWVVMLECPSQTYTVTNTISPNSQTACLLASPQTIVGTDDNAIYQDDVLYQWQISSDSLTWTNILGATGRSFLPEPTSNTTYFRRIANWNCQKSDTSNVHTLFINNDGAPTANAGGQVYYTCPSSPVTLGGTPAASGGTAPYTYTWDFASTLNNANIANPTATVSEETIYTLEVLDNLGCRKIDQVVVKPYVANAGIDKSVCEDGPGVQIGTAPPQGLNATYSWSPTTGLSNPNIAQPIAAPLSTTDYTLTVTYTNVNSIVCSTNDVVRVTVTPKPPTANFAGPDRILCLSAPTTTTLGTAADPGYTYTWSPGQYLENNTLSQVTFNSGNVFSITPNPITYLLTAQRDGCAFVDTTVVSVIRANAGVDVCGPAIIGTPDLTPNLSETYSWFRISSTNNTTGFLGSTTAPTAFVSSSDGGTDIYRLEVSLGGTTCRDTVIVTDCGCVVEIENTSGNCPLFTGTNLSLLATAGDPVSQNPNNFTYTWTPAAGLSATTGRQVFLTDAVNRTYTVTATSTIDPSFSCSEDIEVNNPAWSFPGFVIRDTAVCSGSIISLGNPPVAGYSYEWTGPNNFSNFTSNPTLLVNSASSGVYTAKVTEDISGCFIQTQKTVNGRGPIANAGLDYTVCANGIIMLGTPDTLGGSNTYAWLPASAPWQNGTDENSAQPEVLLTISSNFIVTVTDALGCVNSDTVAITVNNNPTIANAADQSICLGDTVQIGSPALPGVTYSWSPSTGLSNPNIAQPIASPSSTTNYTVTAIFPGNCISNPTDAVTVTVFDPTFDLGADLDICPPIGVSIGTNAPSSGVAQYVWSPATGLSSTSIRNPTATPAVATTYSLRVIYTNGCEFTDEITVTPRSEPEAGFNRTVCLGESTTIGSPSNSGTIAWSGTGVAALSSTSSPTPIFNSNVSGAGTFNLTLTMTVSGCTRTDSIRIVVSPLPTITPTSASVCIGGCTQIGVTPQPFFTYNWFPTTELSSSTIANPTVCPTASRVYQLTATSVATGCSVTENVLVTLTPQTAPSITADSVLACVGTPFTFNTTVSPPGSYSYLWTPATGLSSPFVQEPSAIVNNTTVYNVQVTDNSTGCAGEAQFFVAVASANNPFTFTQPNSVNFPCTTPPAALASFFVNINSPGTFSYQWQENKFLGWQNLSDDDIFSGATSPNLVINNLNGLENADYRVVITQLDGCGQVRTSNAAALRIDTCFVILPVELVSFDATKNACVVDFKWRTASEFNNDFFTLYRSEDADRWIEIGTIYGSGTTFEPKSYSFRDGNPVLGVNYYRLKQTDYDGTEEWFKIVAVDLSDCGNSIVNVYPNPSSTIINIQMTDVRPIDVVLAMYNAAGALVLSERMVDTNLHQLNVSNLAAGSYILTVQKEDKIRLFKVIVGR